MDSLNKNYIIYFSFYFVSQLLLVIVHVYLPIYFFNVLNVNRAELAFVQIFSYLAFFTKPILSIYFDKKEVKSKRKIFISIGSLGTLLSYIFLILNLEILVIFGVFLAINFMCISLIDVCIDKTILENSKTERIKRNSTLFLRLGTMMGSIFPVITFLILFSNPKNTSSWAFFFMIGVFSIIPLLFLSQFIIISKNVEVKDKILKDDYNLNSSDAKSIIFMCIFMLFLYALKLYEYPFEPWVINKYFNGDYINFSIFIFIMVLMNTFGIIIAGITSIKFSKKKTLIMTTIPYGILTIIIPFSNLFLFLILAILLQFIAGIIIVNYTILMINLAKEKVKNFQIIASFVLLANVIYIPLGTYLSSYIKTEFIIIIAGILILISLIPLIFIKDLKEIKQ